MTFIHPEKWRETCDPFCLTYHDFQLTEVLGYPHARNDVFHVRGLHHGEPVTAYIKVARHDPVALARDVHILSQLDALIYPRVFDAGDSPVAFSVTEALPGIRLSVLLGENKGLESLEYMEEYGAALAQLHTLRLCAAQQADRRFHHRPPDELLIQLGLAFLKDFFAIAPPDSPQVFCHGDFHYANLLWDKGHISAILDFELAGYGNRDYDIAWAMFCRPGQRFLRTPEEQQLFLRGYSRHGEYNAEAVRYYMAQNYVYFLQSNDDAPEYCHYIRTWLAENCT